MAVPRRDTSARRVVGVVIGLNIVSWLVFAAAATSDQQSPVFVSAATLSFVLGMRHAFDADHIAAIDDTTRLMVSRGRRPVGLGLGFAAGHSLVVLILCAVVAVTAGSAVQAGLFSGEWTTGVTVLAAGFLLLVGILNLLLLRRLLQQRRGSSDGSSNSESVSPGGIATRMFGRRIFSRVDSGWHMIPIGFLFGLGMETASEVALLGLSATGDAMSPLAILSLPLLFASGMALFDTLDSLLMTRIYTSPNATSASRFTLNAVMTGLTALIGIGIGMVYVAEVLSDMDGFGILRPLAALGEHAELIGAAVICTYVGVWLIAAIHTKRTVPPPALTAVEAS